MVDEPEADADAQPTMSWKAFLEGRQPMRVALVTGAFGKRLEKRGATYDTVWTVQVPDLDLHCGSDRCGGIRTFQGFPIRPPLPPTMQFDREQREKGRPLGNHEFFVGYWCRNCQRSVKTYAVQIERVLDGESQAVPAMKFGENPPLLAIRGADSAGLDGAAQDLFVKGQQAEALGLGIGAFAYYRRVLDIQKDRIIGQLMEVARRQHAEPALLERLEAAGQAWRFEKSIDEIKPAIPDSLKIRGENPLILLHRASS